MKIKEAAEACGLSAHTIRYYERSGMLPPVTRGADGHRAFSQENVDWLRLLASLRATGMPTKSMQAFAALYRDGNATVAARKQMLLTHQKHLDTRQAELSHCRELLNFKLSRYNQILGES